MKLRTSLLAPLIFIIFILGIGGTIAFNLWKTEAGKTLADLKAPGDIKGSHKFSLISQAFQIPLEDLFTAFGIKDQTDFQCNKLETLYAKTPEGEIGVDSVRLFVALSLNQSHPAEASTRLLPTAYDVLKAKVSAETLALAEKYLLKTVPSPAQTTSASPSPVAPSTTSSDRTIKGGTTFGDLLSWGVTQAEIETIIGGPIGASNKAVKSLADEKGVEFSTWKTGLQAKVDAGK